MSLARDLRRAAELGWRGRLDLLRAVIELAIARARLSGSTPKTLAIGKHDAPDRISAAQSAIIERVAFAIPRAATRVPWRATCLVQAMAAQRWLAREGIASQVKLGARKSVDDGLDAHAWLEADGRIVVGGDPQSYRPFNPARPG